jgi:Protein of unknown function (DUF4100)
VRDYSTPEGISLISSIDKDYLLYDITKFQMETGLWLLREWSSLCWLWKTAQLDEPAISADCTKVLRPRNQTLLCRTIVAFVVILAILILPLERILSFAFLFGHLGNSCHFSTHRSESGNSTLRRSYRLYDRRPIKATLHPRGHCRRSHSARHRRPRKAFLSDKEYPSLLRPGGHISNTSHISGTDTSHTSSTLSTSPTSSTSPTLPTTSKTPSTSPTLPTTSKTPQTSPTLPLHVNQLQNTSLTMSGSENSSGEGIVTPPLRYRTAVMPRPNQSGALYFDKTNITDFLRRWDIECEDYGLTDSQKCARIIDYCAKDIQDVIELLKGYTERNWETLQAELKKLYWQYDKQKGTTTTLNQLIKDAPNLDLNIFVLRYTSLSAALVSKGALSPLDQVNRLLDGLPEKLRNRAIEFCTEQDWHLSSHDTGSKDPEFDKLQKFVLTKAEASQKKTVYDQERALREHPTDSVSTEGEPTPRPSTPSTVSPSVTAPTSTPTPDIAELARQFSRLTLALEASLGKQRSPTTTTTSTVPLLSTNALGPSVQRPLPDRPFRCVWCDSLEHRRNQCAEFSEMLRSGRICLNDQNRVVNAITGEEIPTNFGRGGMKKPFEQFLATYVPQVANVTNITAECGFGEIGGNHSVRLTTIDRNGVVSHQIVDADVAEKRRRGDTLGRNVRPRLDDGRTDNVPIPTIPQQNQPVLQPQFPQHRAAPIPPVPPPNTPAPVPPPVTDTSRTASQDQAMDVDPPVEKPKYRLASKLQESINLDEIGEKIMDVKISLSLNEIFGISSDVSNWLNDRTRRTRRPIDTTAANFNATDGDVLSISANVNNLSVKPLYACPSGRAPTLMNNKLDVSALLDDGSELNLMPKRTWERLGIPIDSDINWRINGYDSKGTIGSRTEYSGPLGVCHSVLVNIGGVEARIPIFVVEYSNQDLLLGRPWARYVRAVFINEDNGDYTCIIKSPDGRFQAEFVAAKAEHERNRAFAKEPEEGVVGLEWGKV